MFEIALLTMSSHKKKLLSKRVVTVSVLGWSIIDADRWFNAVHDLTSVVMLHTHGDMVLLKINIAMALIQMNACIRDDHCCPSNDHWGLKRLTFESFVRQDSTKNDIRDVLGPISNDPETTRLYCYHQLLVTLRGLPFAQEKIATVFT